LVTKPIETRDLNRALEKWLPPEKINRKNELTTSETMEFEKMLDDAANEESKDITNFLDILDQIPEINTDIGMSHVSGMKILYYEGVSMFYKMLPVDCEKMSAFLKNSDIGNFAISVHAMKSILATIGAVSLSESALKLETAAKKKEYDYCAKYYPELEEKLLSLYKRLSGILPEKKDNSVKQPGDLTYLRANIAKAMAAIEDFDNDAGIEAMNNLLSYDFGKETNVLLQNTLAAFKNFDFTGAAEGLEAVK
jgi:HPt (histidine-containing phosphotransfer) domain-containing protein